MKGTLNRRHRVLRVRHVQHSMAMAETVQAQDDARNIAHNADRVRAVRADLFRSEGEATGASFAAMQELASRLEQAGRQLDGALYDAQRKVEAKQDLSVTANREREIASRLKERAHAQLEEWRETRLAALPRYRRIQARGVRE